MVTILNEKSHVVYHPYHTRKVGGTTFNISRFSDEGKRLEDTLFNAIGGRPQDVDGWYAFTIWEEDNDNPIHIWVLGQSIIIGTILKSYYHDYIINDWKTEEV